jgi:hypothetical protein
MGGVPQKVEFPAPRDMHPVAWPHLIAYIKNIWIGSQNTEEALKEQNQLIREHEYLEA